MLVTDWTYGKKNLIQAQRNIRVFSPLSAYSFFFEYWTLLPPLTIAPNEQDLWNNNELDFWVTFTELEGVSHSWVSRECCTTGCKSFSDESREPSCTSFQIFISFSSCNSTGATVTVILNQRVLQGMWPHLSLWTLLIFSSSCTGTRVC